MCEFKVIQNAVFLDCDGVFVTKKNLEHMHRMGIPDKDEYERKFDPACVENFTTLINETRAKIIMTSSWRLKGINYIKEMWQKRGMPGEIIGITPIIKLDMPQYRCPRGMEIFAWMDGIKEELEIKNYVIIDDFSDMLYDHRNNFVQTSWSNGFDKIALEKALTILKR